MNKKSGCGCYLPGWALAGFIILWMMGHFWYGVILCVIVMIIAKKAGKI